MIDVSIDNESRTVTLKLSGMVSEGDHDRANEVLEADAGRDYFVRVRGGVASVKFLLDWEDLEGWELGAKSMGSLFALSVRDAISRLAVIAEPKWHGEHDRLADICNRGEVRFFTPERRAEATAWLQS